MPSDRFSLDGATAGVNSIDTGSLQPLATSLDRESLTQLPGVNNFSDDAGRVEQATYDRATQLLQPEFDRQDRRLNTRLANTGIPIGSEAYNDAYQPFLSARDQAYTNAANDAVQAGRAEQSRLFGLGLAGRQQGINEQLSDAQLAMQNRGIGFNEMLTNANLQNAGRSRDINESLLERTQPMNELAALLQGSPAINGPAVGGPAQYQIAPGDIQGAIMNEYNQKAANQQATLGGLYNLGGALGGAAIGIL